MCLCWQNHEQPSPSKTAHDLYFEEFLHFVHMAFERVHQYQLGSIKTMDVLRQEADERREQVVERRNPAALRWVSRGREGENTWRRNLVTKTTW